MVANQGRSKFCMITRTEVVQVFPSVCQLCVCISIQRKLMKNSKTNVLKNIEAGIHKFLCDFDSFTSSVLYTTSRDTFGPSLSWWNLVTWNYIWIWVNVTDGFPWEHMIMQLLFSTPNRILFWCVFSELGSNTCNNLLALLFCWRKILNTLLGMDDIVNDVCFYF